MSYFSGIGNVEDLKKKYRELVMKYHPDISKGDTTRIMQDINIEYKKLLAQFMAGGGFTQSDIKEELDIEKEYYEVLTKLAKIQGIKIELVGTWIWISGNTYATKDKLKEAGCLWAPKKMLWYYRSPEHKTKRKSNLSIDEIKAKYGSKDITGKYSKNESYLNDQMRKKRKKAKK